MGIRGKPAGFVPLCSLVHTLGVTLSVPTEGEAYLVGKAVLLSLLEAQI